MKSFIVLIFILTSISCLSSKQISKKEEALKKLYARFKNSEISECQYQKEAVFIVSKNIYDAETLVFNLQGEQIGVCNYTFNRVDLVCQELEECKVIYRCKNHINGQPFVDIYELSSSSHK